MTALNSFTPPARQTIIRAGLLAGDYGRDRLSTEFFLLALAGSPSLSGPVGLGISATVISAEIKAKTPGRQARELLATLGIDLDEVRRRAIEATSTPLDDPSLWRLHRSRVRPLRVPLSGPAAEIMLDESGRKVIPESHRSSAVGQPPRATDADRPRRPALGPARRRFRRIGEYPSPQQRRCATALGRGGAMAPVGSQPRHSTLRLTRPVSVGAEVSIAASAQWPPALNAVWRGGPRRR